MVNVGIVGLGFMGVTHFNTYKTVPGAKVVAICDRQPERLRGEWASVGGNIAGDRKNEDLTGIRPYADVSEMLADRSIDLIDICLATNFHKDVAIAALEAGKHVLLEKPMAASVKDARAIRDAAAKAKKYFMVGHCVRFSPAYAATYEMIKSKKYGKVREIFMRRVASPPAWAHQNWLMNGAASGGAVIDLHIHDIDYMLYLMGTPERVSSWGEAGPSGAIDVVHSSFDYPGGVRATVIGGWVYKGTFPFNFEFTIRCEKATFACNLATGGALTVYLADGTIETPKLAANDGYWHEIKYLVDCIATKKRPKIVTADSSLASLELAAKELKSIETGRPVRIAPARRPVLAKK